MDLKQESKTFRENYAIAQMQYLGGDITYGRAVYVRKREETVRLELIHVRNWPIHVRLAPFTVRKRDQ